MTTLETASELLGGAQTLGVVVCADIDFVETSRVGLPAKAAALLADALTGSADPATGRHTVLGSLNDVIQGVDTGEGRRLTAAESDLVIRIAMTFARAIEVLGDRFKAARWLTSENRALGGIRPIALLDTYVGTREVEKILGRIEHGVYS